MSRLKLKSKRLLIIESIACLILASMLLVFDWHPFSERIYSIIFWLLMPYLLYNWWRFFRNDIKE